VIAINDDLRNAQTPDKIWISYKKLFDTVTEGAVILLDDGAIEVRQASSCSPFSVSTRLEDHNS
jgi:pyruvate kinase